MKKVGIVSCDKWIGKINEDINLKNELNDLGIDANIISWQQPFNDNYDALILRSVWGYQNYYNEFKKWLLEIKEKNISLYNNPDLIINNIDKKVQFDILKRNDIDYIKTRFISKSIFLKKHIFDEFENISYVIKPTISGSGENTFLVSNKNDSIPNTITKDDIFKIYTPLMNDNPDCNIMVQPYIPEVNKGEYSCIFIGGQLTHTMLRFPNVFHDKKRTYLLENVPDSIMNLAKKVEQIPEFKEYLYMRVDMVLIGNEAKIMEVELAEPDLLTKYIEDESIKTNVIKTLAKKIEERIK